MEECVAENVENVELPRCNFDTNKRVWRRYVRRKCHDPSKEWPQRNIIVRNREKVEKSFKALQPSAPGSVSNLRRAPRPRILTREKPYLGNEYCERLSNLCVGFTEYQYIDAGHPDESANNDPQAGSFIVDRLSVRKGGPPQRSAHVARIEVLELKKALFNERESLHKLYTELEEERCASATAANEAIAMITRLQEEKAAALMESRQYRCAAEEREAHSQEAISLLKAALLDKETELQALQGHVGTYRKMLEYKTSGERVFVDSTYGNAPLQKDTIEATKDGSDELVENQHHDESLHSKSARKFHKDTQNHPPIMETGSSTVANQSDYFQQKSPCDCRYLQTDWRAENVEKEALSPEDTSRRKLVYEEAEREIFVSEWDDHSHSQKNTFEDANMTILARVENLEERFRHLQRCQDVDYGRPANLNSEIKRNAFGWNSVHEELEKHDESHNMVQAQNALPCEFYRSQTNCSMDGGHQVLFGESNFLACDRICNTVIEERSNLSSIDLRVDSDIKGHMFQRCDMNILKGLNRQVPMPEAEHASEVIHDVYEVKCEGSENAAVHNSCLDAEKYHPWDDCYIKISKESNMQRFEINEHFSSTGNEALEETPTKDKLLLDLGCLEVKCNLKHSPDGCLLQLKEKLKALEGEREFMKWALDCLRKENKDLKLLQEIAQHIQGIKGDNRILESKDTGQHQLPLFSFLKFQNFFSFTGSQNCTDADETRCPFLQSLKSECGQKQHDGLFQLLSTSSEVTKSVCITRGHKVKFAMYGGT